MTTRDKKYLFWLLFWVVNMLSYFNIAYHGINVELHFLFLSLIGLTTYMFNKYE